MRLERLEISGFKSFSDRAELAFDHGVTAIVGPNGCGKSNVADAITWVLGEQSAKSLRGDKMEDVIFSGSDARKPGATAEVRLRLTGLPRAADETPARTCRRAGVDSPSTAATATVTTRQRQRERQRRITRRCERDCARLYARRRSHAAAVPVRRERVPDRRRGLPPARRPRAADGHRARRQGLRDHRAGQDRHDPQLAAGRSPSADRGGRRHHQVQVAPARPPS